ncbi:MAG: hypothetical protein KF784_18230 [Fimbriimonadaceae bacterium]|jgi:hypothetical protein|nr:hypothetical protein [Nitrospira sp.]MBX3121001.1 hypothetical protein [Fimbriimonadaceae bacterium]MBX3649423.1 hypothetical protein [Rhodocyclaceae bacterium]HAP38548.1 hypothetical protein [Nitrospira sp.]HNV25423.1 hypothetical protein [Nitrospira sp.]
MKHEAISAAMALTALLLTGCASPPQMQEKFGKSLAALKAAQIGTSDSRRSDLEALDGLAAEMVMRGYRRTFDRSQDGGMVAPPLPPPGMKEAIGAAMPPSADNVHP